MTPVAALLDEIMPGSVKLLTGVPLNTTTGGLNPYAVEHGFKLSVRLVWMPTFSAADHIRHSHPKQFLPPRMRCWRLRCSPSSTSAASPRTAKQILDQIAAYDAVLYAGHLHISEVWPLFAEADERGATRLLVTIRPS